MTPDIVFTKDVEDNLNSNRADKPLSARMGQVLAKTIANKMDAEPITEKELEELLK